MTLRLFPSRVRRAFQPLRRKLPLLISALLAAVVAAYTWIAHARVVGAMEAATGERLDIAARQVASILAQSVARFHHEVSAAAEDPAVIATLAEPTPDAIARTRSVLAVPPPGTTRLPSRALFTRGCRRVAAVGPNAVQARCPRTAAMRQGHVGGFRRDGDSVVVDVTAPVVTASGDTLGFVAEARRMTGAGANPVARLLGNGVSVLIGNHAGTLWTDLLRPLPGPRTVPPFGRLVEGTDARRRRMFRVAAEVPGADWVVMVQIPHADAAAPLRGLLAGMLAVAIGCVLAGALVAYFISRRVTGPMAEIERAAAGIAAGDYSRRVAVRRRDELGRLAGAFNIMAGRIATSRSLLEDMLACAPFGVAIVDTELRFLQVNDAMAGITAMSVEAHIGAPPSVVAPAMGSLLEPILRSVIASGTPAMNQRVSTLGERGAKRHWVATVFPVRDAAGSVAGAALMVLDTTEHHELHARYLQAQKMEAVGRLAGGVAHDFNNILTVILSYSAMAIEALGREQPLRRDLEEIRDAGERAAALTKQLLAFSRNQVLQPRVVSVNAVATRMQGMLQRLLGEHVRLELRLDAGLADVHADPGQLEQVIMNLAVNARDAMPDGGVLVIETANAARPSDPPSAPGAGGGGQVMLAVRDEGIGMSPEVQSHLFEPFFTTKPAGEGTGLGLATVYGIVKQSGGEIQVTSAPGAGTTVAVYLPRSTALAAASAGPVAHDESTGAETVLLVEDDPALQALCARVLQRAGYRVLVAPSPEGAIELGRSQRGVIDLLLTDVVMPGMHGGAVADELVRLRPGLRTVFMSGYPDEEVVRRGIVADESAFLQKPFTPTELTRRIREALDARVKATA